MTMEAVVVSPAPGSPMRVAMRDLRAAIGLWPVWGHVGWINIRWQFRRTRVGPFWHTLTLAAFILTLGAVWAVALGEDPSTHFRYVTTGAIVWSLISTTISGGASSLTNESNTALSIRFPAIVFAFQFTWGRFILFLHHFILYIFIFFITSMDLTSNHLLVIPGLILLLLNGLWIVLICGIIGLWRQDFIHMASTGVQILMFVTPVFWPRDMFGPELSIFVDFNPLFHLVEIVRNPLLGAAPTAANWLWSAAFLLVGGMTSLFIYGCSRERLTYWY